MSNAPEIWKPVVGFEGRYEVSSFGRVRSLDRVVIQTSRAGRAYGSWRRGRVLRPGPNKSGHLSVVLGRGNTRLVHALVLAAFVGPAPDGHEGRHLNGNETDNVFGNLQWSTRARNSQDKKWHKGAKNYKLSAQQVAYIKRDLFLGTKGTSLAREYGVCETTISNIKHGRVHVDV